MSAIRITVKDSGVGIFESNRHTLFESLSNKSLKNGLGLGLSICKGILNQLGTEIWLEKSSTKKKAKNHGSVFAFRLPVANTSFSPKSNSEPKRIMSIESKGQLKVPIERKSSSKDNKYNSAPSVQLEPILELDNEDDYMIDDLLKEKNISSEPSESDQHSQNKRKSKNIKILIAEDAPLDRSMLKVLFSESFKYS